MSGILSAILRYELFSQKFLIQSQISHGSQYYLFSLDCVCSIAFGIRGTSNHSNTEAEDRDMHLFIMCARLEG